MEIALLGHGTLTHEHINTAYEDNHQKNKCSHDYVQLRLLSNGKDGIKASIAI